MADYDEENECCPLCMEELDLTDQTFNACPCGYQVCLWCWHQIKNEYNGLCPACRQPYAELSKQKNPLDREEVVRRTKQRKQKEKNERRSAAQSKHSNINRKSLQNVRVMQRNLVYVIGLPVHFAEEEILRSNECFGQYGKIVKAVVNKSHLSADRANATASAYITFAHKEDALCCILAIDGYYLDGSMLRASFGTTKYCNFFLRNMQCNNPDCLYLHELGDEDDSFTKEEMQTALHSGKAAFRDISMVNGQVEERAGSRFPPPHRPPTSSSSSSSRSAPSSAKATTLVRSHSEEVYGNSQRHAQSAAAISKLRQASGDLYPKPSSSLSSDHNRGTIPPSTKYPPLARDNLYSKVVTGGTSTNSYVPAATVNCLDTNKKPHLWVDTSRAEDTTQAVDAVTSPLEALKLATGSSTEKPAWAQPFPTPSVVQHDTDEPITTTRNSTEGGVYSPFGLGFDGGIRCPSSGNELMTKSPSVSRDVWESSSISDTSLTSFSPAVPPLPSASSSSLSFASIDAIFSQRNDSTEALAGLLGIQLAPESIVPTRPLGASSKDGHTSRFSFANPTEAPSSRYELLDGTKVNDCRSFGSFDACRYDSEASGFASTTDRSDFPPLGSSPKELHATPAPPPPLSRGSFGSEFRGAELPLGGSGALTGETDGLAFLQQMLPNVNISFGGDYPGFNGDAVRSSSAGRSSGRRLFERSQSTGLVSSDSWDGGSRLSSLGFDSSQALSGASFSDPALLPRSSQALSGASFSDPALVPRSSSGFSNDFYGFQSSESESERVRLHGDLR